MKHGAGWPMGPCELVDLVGIDVHVHASEALYEKTQRAAHGRTAAPRRDAERRAARPQERPRLLQLLGREPDGLLERRRLAGGAAGAGACGHRRATRRA